MTRDIELLFLSAQLLLFGCAILASSLGDDDFFCIFMMLSTFFGGAAIGSSVCRRFHGK